MTTIAKIRYYRAKKMFHLFTNVEDMNAGAPLHMPDTIVAIIGDQRELPNSMLIWFRAIVWDELGYIPVLGFHESFELMKDDNCGQ